MRNTLRLGAMILAAVLPLTAACGDDGEPTASTSADASATASPTASVPEIAITGIDFGYEISGTATAGLTKISFTNAGKEEHMTGLGKLQPGKTIADVQTALKSNDESAFGTVFDEKEGDKDAPQVLSPGYAASTYTTLSEGTYALICFIPSPDGKPHFEKGMLSELKVGPAAGATATAPTPAVELAFNAGKLTGPATLPAGKTVFKVTTDANHELIGLVPLNGATPEKALAYIESKFSDKPPTGPALGAIALQLHDFEPGEDIVFELDLKPGTLMLGCELEGDDGKKHTERLVITVT